MICISLKNFKKYTNAEFEILPNIATGILGPSGAGKSTVFNAITYAITGACKKPVKRGCKSCQVVVQFETVCIVRRHGPKSLHIYCQDTVYESGEAQAFLDKEYKYMLNSFVCHTKPTFFIDSAEDKKMTLEKLAFDDYPVEKVRQNLRRMYKDATVDARQISTIVSTLESIVVDDIDVETTKYTANQIRAALNAAHSFNQEILNVINEASLKPKDLSVLQKKRSELKTVDYACPKCQARNKCHSCGHVGRPRDETAMYINSAEISKEKNRLQQEQKLRDMANTTPNEMLTYLGFCIDIPIHIDIQSKNGMVCHARADVETLEHLYRLALTTEERKHKIQEKQRLQYTKDLLQQKQSYVADIAHVQETFEKCISKCISNTLDLVNTIITNYVQDFFYDDINISVVYSPKPDVIVKVDGVPVDWKTLSGGELARAGLAVFMGIAIADGTKHIFLDEVLATLDTNTALKVISSIKNNFTGASVWIAHQSDISSFDTVITVTVHS